MEYTEVSSECRLDKGFSRGVLRDASHSAVYRIQDHLSSTRMLKRNNVDGPEAVTAAYDYLPYGKTEELFVTAEQDALRKFTGKEYDDEGGSRDGKGIRGYHFGARVYDPVIGVWRSVDPKHEFADSYGYIKNPEAFIDPDGQDFGASAAIIISAVVTAAYSSATAMDQNMGVEGVGYVVVSKESKHSVYGLRAQKDFASYGVS